MYRGYTLLWRKILSDPVLVEPGKPFSRLEAWVYITNVLAAGMDDQDAGLKRGKFVASVRFLAKAFNWSHPMAQRFVDQLIENSMIMRVIHQSIHPASLKLRRAGLSGLKFLSKGISKTTNRCPR